MVYRIFVEKKAGLDHEAKALLRDVKNLLQIDTVEDIRLLNRYDVENIDEKLFAYAQNTVFAEPQLDVVTETFEAPEAAAVFATEYLPGQFDQRADSAAQCIQIISQGERPTVRTAKVYAVYGVVTAEQLDAIKKYVINPMESREASMEPLSSLAMEYEIPTEVAVIDGFLELDRAGLTDFVAKYGLAMDVDDAAFCQTYFRNEKRNPTITEIRMIDTYWSDHCRHTTFSTTIDKVSFEDPLLEHAWQRYIGAREAVERTKPMNLMDIGTIAAKVLKKQGKLPRIDESEEINACTVKIKVDVEGEEQDWLLLFKNETHNHPTEIEPFGGAATCVGGAIRDPLSGRSYVYAAMRVTGAADPLKPVRETMEGKLPQRTIVTTAAAGYSSYGNQIGLTTGIVDELYHDGYAAKRMEIGAVVGAAPAENVRRERPVPGDVIILLGGKTGRDGCGGATGSSKSHTLESLETCGAEVQKGNAPEERKLQRLFRNKEASRLIKRCNDFGAGGVSVAIGELADGLLIDLNKVPKKYEGLDGTELAISESQERMAVVVAADDAEKFLQLAASENLEAIQVAVVTEEPRLVQMWNGKAIVDISREFLDSNGAEKHIEVIASKSQDWQKTVSDDFAGQYRALASDLNVCSKRGLAERFDSTIGGGTVLMPFGGKYQRTPIQAMVHKLPVEGKETTTCSLMSWAYNPYIAEKSPYHSAYLAVVESVSKLIATGAEFKDVYLTFQEYFEKLGKDSRKWGKPLAALLGALKAQLKLGIAAIGGKDSMSGTFEDLTVPPTLVSFAVTTEEVDHILSPEFKKAGHKVYLMKPEQDDEGLPSGDSLIKLYGKVQELTRAEKAVAAYTPGFGGVAEAVLKMTMGNGLGFCYDEAITMEEIFGYHYGAFVLEMADGMKAPEEAVLLGEVTAEQAIGYQQVSLSLKELEDAYEEKLESVFTCNLSMVAQEIPAFSYDCKVEDRKVCGPSLKVARPKVLIPVFPGTNCEYDTAKVMERAGAEAEIFVIRNLSSEAVSRSIEEFAARLHQSQMVFIPGGFSGGDEPDGSGKFITAFFRNEMIKEGVEDLLNNRDGLMAGICNGFQALIKLGLVPYGKIIDTDADCPTLTYNTIGRHQSKLVQLRIASNKSPWLANTQVGDVYTVPVSHGEGRFLASDIVVNQLAENGQIATQYVDFDGNPTNEIQFNPNNSVFAIEGITSPDGRVFGKMGHAERIGYGLYKNVPGEFDMKMFQSAVAYFK
ncbi:MAG: phosphoribosylformylglycinamidine synthase [Firmicutes bacterium]|nr:phosphoribosylformylglycinamidine synthase [Bacillota bacterium]